MNLVRRLLHTLTERLPVASITGPDEDPQICRYLLCELGSKAPVRLYLQRLVRSDPDYVYHDRPWDWVVSVVLHGRYRETRMADWFEQDERHRRRVLRPGSWNYLRFHTFHQLTLLTDECWMLFLTGPVVQTWSVWDETTNRRVSWRTFYRLWPNRGGRGPALVGRMA